MQLRPGQQARRPPPPTPARAFPPFSPHAATRPPTYSWEVVGRLRAHCLIPRRRVPRSPKCVAVCVTDGASGACEGIRVHLLLKGASTLVQSSLDYCGEERGVRGSLPTLGRLCLGLSSSSLGCPLPQAHSKPAGALLSRGFAPGPLGGKRAPCLPVPQQNPGGFVVRIHSFVRVGEEVRQVEWPSCI